MVSEIAFIFLLSPADLFDSKPSNSSLIYPNMEELWSKRGSWGPRIGKDKSLPIHQNESIEFCEKAYVKGKDILKTNWHLLGQLE